MIESEGTSRRQHSTNFLDSVWDVAQSALGGNMQCWQSYAYASTNMSMVEVTGTRTVKPHGLSCIRTLELRKCPWFTYACHEVRFKDHLQLPDGEWRKRWVIFLRVHWSTAQEV